MNLKFPITLLVFSALLISNTVTAQQFPEIKENFSNPANAGIKMIGRGECKVNDGVLKSKDAYVCFGNSDWKNYRITFKARVPEDAEQVQIWAGFRAFNRFDRYIFGFRGGLQDDLYLSRMGYMGTDEFLGLRQLDFHPLPGKWYDFKIEVCGDRIRIFLNNETLPRLDIRDKNTHLAPSGEVTLGGSWIENEFDDLSITPLNDNYLSNWPVQELKKTITAEEKEQKRQKERAGYTPVIVDQLQGSRTEISLNGTWLFMPEYVLSDKQKAVSNNTNDKDWHTMPVPNFWNPIRIWLHGETFGPFAKGVSDRYYEQETDRCENYTFDYRNTKAAWYRQWIELPYNSAAKNIELTFDAVSKVAEVYINGQLAGSHIGMFGNFKIDGSKLLFKPGKNLIVVKVTRDFINDIKEADKIVNVAVTVPVTNRMLKDIAHGFYGGDPAGIWQPVSLVITDPVKIEDAFIKPSLTGADLELTVKNHSAEKVKFTVLTDIIEKSAGNLFHTATPLQNIELKPKEERIITYSVTGLKPLIYSVWSGRTLQGCGNRTNPKFYFKRRQGIDFQLTRIGAENLSGIYHRLYCSDRRRHCERGNSRISDIQRFGFA
jgi:hypothetical protein